MSKPVRSTKVTTGTKDLTVSTVKIGFRSYDTVVFDDSPDKRYSGKRVGSWVIDELNVRTATRDEAMNDHREAVYAARVEDIR